MTPQCVLHPDLGCSAWLQEAALMSSDRRCRAASTRLLVNLTSEGHICNWSAWRESSEIYTLNPISPCRYHAHIVLLTLTGPKCRFPNMTAVSLEDSKGLNYESTVDFLIVGIPGSILSYALILTLGYSVMMLIGW